MQISPKVQVLLHITEITSYMYTNQITRIACMSPRSLSLGRLAPKLSGCQLQGDSAGKGDIISITFRFWGCIFYSLFTYTLSLTRQKNFMDSLHSHFVSLAFFSYQDTHELPQYASSIMKPVN